MPSGFQGDGNGGYTPDFLGVINPQFNGDPFSRTPNMNIVGNNSHYQSQNLQQQFNFYPNQPFKNYQNPSPISPLSSSIDFSPTSSDLSAVYGMPIHQLSRKPAFSSSPVDLTTIYQTPIRQNPMFSSSPIDLTRMCQTPIHQQPQNQTFSSSPMDLTTMYQTQIHQQTQNPVFSTSTVMYQTPVHQQTQQTQNSTFSSSAIDLTAMYQTPIHQRTQNPTFSSSPIELTKMYQTPIHQQTQNPVFSSSPVMYQTPVHQLSQKHESFSRVSDPKFGHAQVNLREIEDQLFDDYYEQYLQEGISVNTDNLQSLISVPSHDNDSSCSKQLLMEAAIAIYEGKIESATEIIGRLSKKQRSNPEQRMVFYMVEALKSRLNPRSLSGFIGTNQTEMTQLLFQHVHPFKLGFMAANLAIMQATRGIKTFHIIDFNLGDGLQYQNLIQLYNFRKNGRPNTIKITAVRLDEDDDTVSKSRFMKVREELIYLGNRIGISIQLQCRSLKLYEFNRASLGSDINEVFVVNLAFSMHKIPDESIVVRNPREQLLRYVKGLNPQVTVLVEREMNCNTTQLVARVNECCSYYESLFDSLDAVGSLDRPDRLKLEEGLSQEMANLVAREGLDRVFRYEIFGKWRARMGQVGFELKPVSEPVIESLRKRAELKNPGFTVREENGGACFGWMGRTLTVTSAWR